MPAGLAMVPVATKAGTFAAAAVASSGAVDHLSDHVSDFSPQVVTTSFLHLPKPTRISKLLSGPPIAAWNWLHTKWDAWRDQMNQDTPASPDQARMVDYYAASCPHCTHLHPIWKEATQNWNSTDEAHAVVWQKKECYDENWKPGKDFAECKTQHIQGFPTIRFFPPDSKTGDDFFFQRTPEALVDFAKTGIHPNPGDMPRAEGDMSDFKLVDFYAAGCPHCKALDPVWDDATKQWQQYVEKMDGTHEETPVISFEKKECFDGSWKPGKDLEMCGKFNIDEVPTIKLFGTNPTGHGFASVDYKGPRTAEAINDFLMKSAGLPVEESKQLAASDADQITAAASSGDHLGEPSNPAPAEAPAAEGQGVLAKETPQNPVGPPPSEERLLPLPPARIAAAAMSFPMLAASCLPTHRRHYWRHAAPRRSDPPGAVSQFV